MKFYLQVDRFNEERSQWVFQALRAELEIVTNPNEADCIVVIGGDGSLLSAVRAPERGNKPILALNGGTVGANLIDVTKDNIDTLIQLLKDKCYTVISYPVIDIEATDANDYKVKALAFNDAWVDRLDAVSVRYDINISKNGEKSYKTDGFLSGDGVLLSTALGSTGYSRILSDTILPHDSLDIVCAPMLSAINKNKVPAFIMSTEDTICVNFFDTDFRTTRMAIDGLYIKKEGEYFSPVKMKATMCKDKSKWVKMISMDDDSEFHLKRLNFICGMKKA